MFVAQLSSCPPSPLSPPALSSPSLLMRVSPWRVKPKGIPSQSEYQAFHHVRWEEEREDGEVVSSQTDNNNNFPSFSQHVEFCCFSFTHFAYCSLSWGTWHFNIGFSCRFRWTKNGQEFDPFLDPRLMKEENSGTFVIPNNGNLTEYQGTYRCYASNKLGTAISKEIEFIVPRE